MDAFFASIEQRENPELRGKPVAVGGGGKRGVVASASYEARRYGVRSAMPSITALRLCPDLIFTRHQFDLYRQVSHQIREIFFDYTDLVEPLSLDEAYLDVTLNKKDMDDALEIAEEIRHRIFTTTELTASAGVSFNKFLAKTASDINKPNGVKVITREEAPAFIDALPVRKFHGIGKVTADKMHRMGIYTGADLKQLDEITMVKRFGKVGLHYYKIIWAKDERAVNPQRIRKSIGGERTFKENLNSFEGMWERLLPIAKQVYRYMLKSDNFGRTLSLKMKTLTFQIISRSKTFNRELRGEELFLEACKELLASHWQVAGEVRLLGVSVSNLSKEHQESGIQLALDFDGEEE